MVSHFDLLAIVGNEKMRNTVDLDALDNRLLNKLSKVMGYFTLCFQVVRYTYLRT
jgi:hypothetical protein